MTTSVLSYLFNIGGNFKVQMEGFSEATGQLNAQVKQSLSLSDKLVKGLTKFNVAMEGMGRISQSFEGILAPSIALDKSLHELSAITGVTGQGS